jgi:signal transduction histidine kinase
LRTPVASIHGLVQTLYKRRVELDDEQQLDLEQVLSQQTERIKGLVEQLLALSRLDAEAVPIEPHPFAVRPRLEELVATSAGERAPEVDITVPADLVAVVDTDAFDRIVSNLLVNALRYGSPPVIVSATQSDGHFRLTVEDRGPGVPPEFVPDLFDRFTRSRTAAALAGGTGLGLAIARSYAHAHRGELVYEPAEPQGARFQLVIPTSL